MKFTDNPGLKFKDISSEKYRIYVFPNGVRYKIEEPLAVCARRDHGQRVIDKKGKAYWIRPDFIAIEWENRQGEPRVNF